VSNRDVLAIDIGGTKIAAAVVDRNGTILARTEMPTEPENGYPAALSRLKAALHELQDQCGRTIGGIGIGSTGPIDPWTGVYGEVGTLPGWAGSPLAADLENAFGVSVAVENDGDAAALAEAAWGAGREAASLIYVTVSTGIGAGIVLGGRLYRGAGGAHPEIGHQVIDAGGPPCYCQANGCWESLASGPAMERWMRANAAPGRCEDHDLTGPRICELARQGDSLALEAVRRESHYLGLGLANLVTVFCPDAIILGGGMMRSADLFLPGAREVIRRICTQVPAANTAIVLAGLGGDTGLLGAAQAWFHRTGSNDHSI
jgi:glucokinase